MAQPVLLVSGDDLDRPSAEELGERCRRQANWVATLHARGVLSQGGRIDSGSLRVRARAGRPALIDVPADALGTVRSWLLIDADDLDAAVALAGSCRKRPMAPFGSFRSMGEVPMAAADMADGRRTDDRPMPDTPTPDGAGSALAESFRREWPRLVAAAARVVHDLGRAEEIAQDVMVTALDRWPFTGVPDRPGAWLLTATRNRARNAVRDDARARARDEAAAQPDRVPAAELDDPEAIGDDRLRLVFACCHPLLTGEAQVALTLRLIGGLSTAEIARAFVVPESTMAQRLVRAKRSLADARVPFVIPEPEEWGERIPAVLAVVYLIYNEGYQAASGPALSRPVLCREAQRLVSLLAELLPEEADVHGLTALFSLHNARIGTRVDEAGDLVLLEDQDRSRWDTGAIAQGRAAIERALATGPPGPFTVQAMIAA